MQALMPVRVIRKIGFPGKFAGIPAGTGGHLFGVLHWRLLNGNND